MQDWKVALARKVLKKVGQDGEVKLLPREVSKGDGRGDDGETPEGSVVVVVLVGASVMVDVVEATLAELAGPGAVVVLGVLGDASREVSILWSAELVDCAGADGMTDLVPVELDGPVSSCRLPRPGAGRGGGAL